MHVRIALVLAVLPIFASSLAPRLASADDTKAPPGAQHSSTTTAVVEKEMLSNIKPGASSTAAQGAGGAQEVKLDSKSAANPIDRKTATPRVLRRMKTTESIAALAPALEKCAEKNPSTNAMTFTLRLSVAPAGSVEGAELADSSKLAAPMLACVVAAAKTAHFGAPLGAGAFVALPVTVPGKPATGK